MENCGLTNLHKELYQIIVSKKELYWQLDNFFIQDNLLYFFTLDKNSHEYTRLLNLLGVKFELIGSFNYISKTNGKKHLTKPPIKTYYRKIFDDYCESSLEISLGVPPCSNEYKAVLFTKYRAVRYYITPMLATTSEQNYTAMYMEILDYVAKNDYYPQSSFDNQFHFPDALRDKIRHFAWQKHDVHC